MANDWSEAITSPLRCEAITKRYHGDTVLQNITLDIARGAIVGLVGRSGAGKSTLIRILLGLQTADAGSAEVLGEPALSLPDAVKRRLGYVPQQPDALNWMRVGEMLAFIGSFYPRWDQPYVEESLARWGIAPGRALRALSVGERQRVALIRAMAVRPELLVLDEPASALDPVSRRELLRELAVRAAESETTVLFSTHIVSDLERVASHILCLHRHRLLIDAPLDELKETHILLHLSAHSAATMTGKLPGELSRRQRGDGGVSVLLVHEAGSDWGSLEAHSQDQVQLLSLEDLFIELTA